MYENDKKCCLNPKNIEVTLRRTEGSKEFIWLKCRICESVVLKSKAKKKFRALHDQKA